MVNFGAGPATLPKSVMEEASGAVKNYKKTGLSILEIPHRGHLFTEILEEAEHLSKALMGLGDDYSILWIQGGGRLQFSMVPMNFLTEKGRAGYIDSGHWAQDALKTAERYGQVEILASSKADGYRYIPPIPDLTERRFDYIHLTSNNTIYGTQFAEFPKSGAPLVADMSSDIFSRVVDFRRFALIYAAAQKNIGPAGVTFVAVRRSFLEKGTSELPGILSYKAIAEKKSVLNTPPVFAIYCSLLTLRWLQSIGLDNMEKRNEEKAALLYDTISASEIFCSDVQEASRSKMNVRFFTREPRQREAFLDFAQANGITGIDGHRSIGGFRVSLYNAITLDNVKHLVEVMKQFEEVKG